MEFRVLGGLDVRHNGERLDVGASKQRAVLAALLLNANEAVSTERLMQSVWWDRPAAAAANLRVYLSGLRRVLRAPGQPNSRLRTVRAGGYVLDVLPGELDLDQFIRLADRSGQLLRAGQAPAAADCLEQVLGLWRGRALDGVPCGPGLQARVTLLDEQRLAAVEQWAYLRLQLGRLQDVVARLRALAQEYPLRERLWGRLMLALCRCGRPAEALAVYAELRETLARELGADPGLELRQLYERILHGDESLTRSSGNPVDPVKPVAGLLAEPAPPRRLPAATGPLYGRAVELARLRLALRRAVGRRGPAVVTIDGTAGVGKSALAIEAARGCADRYPDGQFYVDLRGATPGATPLSPAEVLGWLLRTLGVPAAAIPAAEAEAAGLFRSLVARRRVLILLDNAADVAQVRPLLPGGAGCAAVVTSRKVLVGLAEAVRLPLGVLSSVDAVAVLGHQVGPDRVTADPGAAIRLSALCGHLPAALHIAGARLAARPGWPVAALVTRLQPAKRRLDELATGSLAVRASIALTYQALAERSQLALRRLGTLRTRDFPSWTLAALLDTSVAEAERLLDELAAVHLVEPIEAAETRYHMHDLIRLYAQEQAAKADRPDVRRPPTIQDRYADAAGHLEAGRVIA